MDDEETDNSDIRRETGICFRQPQVESETKPKRTGLNGVALASASVTAIFLVQFPVLDKKYKLLI